MKHTSLTHILIDRIMSNLFHGKQTQIVHFFTLKSSQELGYQVLCCLIVCFLVQTCFIWTISSLCVSVSTQVVYNLQLESFSWLLDLFSPLETMFKVQTGVAGWFYLPKQWSRGRGHLMPFGAVSDRPQCETSILTPALGLWRVSCCVRFSRQCCWFPWFSRPSFDSVLANFSLC